MPLLAAQRVCSHRNPCRRIGDRCAKCEADDYLTVADWFLLGFYQQVQDQYVNQTPMGAGKDVPPLLTPRLDAYTDALRVFGYPRRLWPWLLQWAMTLHRLHRKIDKVKWYDETGKTLREILPEDVDAADS